MNCPTNYQQWIESNDMEIKVEDGDKPKPIIATTGEVGLRTRRCMTAWLKLTPEQQEDERPAWIIAATKAAMTDGHASTVNEETTVLVFGKQI